MSRPAETLASLRRLYGPRPAHRAIEDAAVGAESLHALIRTWGPMLPRVADLDAAERTIEGLRRVVAELRQHSEKGVPDAA